MAPNKFARVIVSCAVLVWLLPLGWMLWGAFTLTEGIVNPSSGNTSTTLQNFVQAFERPFWGTAFLNSCVVSLISTGIIVPISTLCAYGILKWGQRGPTLLVLSLIATRILPPASVLVAFMALFQVLGLLGTWSALILTNVAMNIGLLTVLALAYLGKIDQSVDEWYRIQSATPFRAFFLVVSSRAIQPVLLLATLSFLFCWNEFLFASAFTAGGYAQTLPVVVSGFITGQDIKWGPMFAACTLAMLPAVAAMWFVERAVVAGLTLGLVRE